MNKTYIIAEAGVNHNGDVHLAKKMIIEAKKAGADAVKFQTFIAENLVSSNAKMAEYQINNTKKDESQLSMLKKLELPYQDFIILSQFAEENEIDFLSTPFDEESVEYLNTLQMPFWKIPSGEITNKPYLTKIRSTNKPIILSTGMSTLQEIKDALQVFHDYKKEDITLLHCNTEYPTPFEDVNLSAMNTLANEFGVRVGYSDHTKGIEIAIAAVAMGAKVIEKHFTLDKTMPGPDHKASLEPNELMAMITSIRNIEKSIGSSEKKPSPSERKNINIVRKSIVAKCNIKAGEVFSEHNLTVKRPGDGVSPMLWDEVVGKIANHDYEKDDKITL